MVEFWRHHLPTHYIQGVLMWRAADMGFASKLEDETERRGGEHPRYGVQRHITIIEGLAPESVLTLGLDDTGYAELDKRLINFKQQCAKHDANKTDVRGVGLKALFRSFEHQKEAAQALVFFLAPRVLERSAQSWNQWVPKSARV